jgi:hypothetical protein
MKETVRRVAATIPFTLDEIDITVTDISMSPELAERYGIEIPVLVVDGTKVAKHHVTEEELKRILLSRSGGSGRSGESGG